MNSHGYEEVEHTADIAIKVWAEDFNSLLIQAARGFYYLIGAKCINDEIIEKEVFIQEGSLESLLVDFLGELLFYIEDQFLFFDEYSFHKQDKGLRLLMKGRLSQKPTLEVKAVTFHNLNVLVTDSGFTATITFDV